MNELKSTIAALQGSNCTVNVPFYCISVIHICKRKTRFPISTYIDFAQGTATPLFLQKSHGINSTQSFSVNEHLIGNTVKSRICEPPLTSLPKNILIYLMSTVNFDHLAS